MKKTVARILYISTEEIKLLDIPRVLDEMGYDIYQASFGISAQGYDKDAFKKIIAVIDRLGINCAISYDFVPTIAQACFETGIPYIAWVYDSPQKELYTHYAKYPCNYIFAFDKMQVRRMQDIGIKHAVHMPLAVHVDKVNIVSDFMDQRGRKEYLNEIAFVGQLYKVENEDALLKQMGESLEQQMHQNIDSCFMKWDKSVQMHGLMSKACVEYLSELEQHKVCRLYPYMSEQFYYEAALLSRMLANRERVHTLNRLADKYDVAFYTYDKDVSQLSEKVKVRAGMSYDLLSLVYQKSKINLNITLHCIETGASQRVLDVMAAGGFLLSNYQEELEEMFVPGEEIVLYHDEQELEELITYYLTHDEERERIARKGQEKVLREYNYQRGLLRAFQYVDQAESKREVSYIVQQREFLRRETDIYLAMGNDEAYQRLYSLYTDAIYETTIQKTTEFSVLREMLECWQREREIGNTCIFVDVQNLQQAEQKYIRVKHGLWRVENNLSYDKCKDVVEYMRNGDCSLFFIAWIVYANLQQREKTYVELSQLFAEESIPDAIELLYYGLMFLKNSPELLIQQANLYMELNLWNEALKVLKQIENPEEEIKVVLKELVEALDGING